MNASRIREFNLGLNSRLFDRRGASYVDRFRELAGALSADSETALHLGAGGVYLEPQLARGSANSRMIALDRNLEGLRRNGSPLRLAGDAESLPLPSSSVDLIVSEHVFEHFPDPLACLRECYRVLRPAGKLIVSGPNGWSYIAILARLTPLGFHRWVHEQGSNSNSIEVFPTFYRFNTPRAMRRLARRAGLRVVRIESFVGEPCYTTWLPLVHLVAIGYHRLLEAFRPILNTHITSVALFEKPPEFSCES